MRIVFFGLGSIGQRHAKILLDNYNHELYAFRSGINSNINNLGIKELHSWAEVSKLRPDIAFITNPTSLHIETAINCAEIGCKLFIEKPIGKDLQDLNKLLRIVRERRLVSYVSYHLRFHPVIIYLRKFLVNHQPLHLRIVSTSFYPNWRKGRQHLKVYSANSKMGGGVILDLSHELDYVYFLLGEFKDMKGSFCRRSNVTIDAEDYVDFLINTKKAPANIHINFFSQILQRYVQIDFNDLTLVGDIINAEISEYRNEKLENKFKVDYHKNQPFEEQMKYFFNNINNPSMMNNLLEAEKLYRKIIEFKGKYE